ncbi:MAG TPA: polysaccharide deacetylase family protein [Pyrinomonadaceae bacterium]
MILCYHSVSQQPIPQSSDQHKLHLASDLFTSHLDYLQRHNHVISLSEYLRARREGRRLPNKTAILTFDDGCRNFKTVAAPLLTERGLPAMSFIIIEKAEGNSNGNQSWTPSDDHEYLSWAEVQALGQGGLFEFGSHSYSHPRLTAIPLEEVERELKDSYAAIVERLGYEAPALAYPHGRTTEEISRLAHSLGYACALTGGPGTNDMETDLHNLQRIIIARDDDVPAFAARVSGLTCWFDQVRAFLKPAAAKVSGQSVPRPQSSVLDQSDL